TTRTMGRMALQGGTELFLESAEPTFDELPLDELLERFPEGEYRFTGRDLDGNRLVGTAVLTHRLPAGPELVFPIEGDPAQDPGNTTLEWKPVTAPDGSPIIAYQVLVVQAETGLPAMPNIALDIIMPPTATSLTVPSGFLQPDTEYEWEVLAIEESGNQTLSSSFLTTTP
ncbi:MAG: fibronectin type III domain-containing protein, partial [Acidimicrobiia bacterium]|nr:fibronectin type III domain-containing protein [Acidimicrobiia bacterium]